MKPVSKLSPTYRDVAQVLDSGWSGTYGDLAVRIGRSSRSGRIIGQLVKSYARRHPDWSHDNVYSKATGRPAYE